MARDDHADLYCWKRPLAPNEYRREWNEEKNCYKTKAASLESALINETAGASGNHTNSFSATYNHHTFAQPATQHQLQWATPQGFGNSFSATDFSPFNQQVQAPFVSQNQYFPTANYDWHHPSLDYRPNTSPYHNGPRVRQNSSQAHPWTSEPIANPSPASTPVHSRGDLLVQAGSMATMTLDDLDQNWDPSLFPTQVGHHSTFRPDATSVPHLHDLSSPQGTIPQNPFHSRFSSHYDPFLNQHPAQGFETRPGSTSTSTDAFEVVRRRSHHTGIDTPDRDRLERRSDIVDDEMKPGPNSSPATPANSNILDSSSRRHHALSRPSTQPPYQHSRLVDLGVSLPATKFSPFNQQVQAPIVLEHPDRSSANSHWSHRSSDYDPNGIPYDNQCRSGPTLSQAHPRTSNPTMNPFPLSTSVHFSAEVPSGAGPMATITLDDLDRNWDPAFVPPQLGHSSPFNPDAVGLPHSHDLSSSQGTIPQYPFDSRVPSHHLPSFVHRPAQGFGTQAGSRNDSSSAFEVVRRPRRPRSRSPEFREPGLEGYRQYRDRRSQSHTNPGSGAIFHGGSQPPSTRGGPPYDPERYYRG
ncbi:hypothetical protein JCM16303_003070 [Sporobolomyces ruberrimus]